MALVVVELDKNYNLYFEGIIKGKEFRCNAKAIYNHNILIADFIACNNKTIIGLLHLDFSKVEEDVFISEAYSPIKFIFAIHLGKYKSPFPWKFLLIKDVEGKKIY